MPHLDEIPARPTPRRTRRALLTGAILLATGAMVVGCSSSAPSGPTPEDAARSVVGGFGLDASELGCLEDAFADEPDARDALAVGGGADTESRRRLRAVLESCITPDELGTALAAATVAAIPGTGPTAEECLKTTIAGYDDEIRGLLLVGFVLSGDAAATELDVELGTRTNQLLATCGVTLTAPGPTDPTGTTIDQTGSAVSTP